MLKNKIRRFSTYRIAEHWIYMTTFIVLAVTGLSQKFHSLDISLWLIFHLGGIDYVRLINRYAGMVFLVVTALHIITGIVCIAAKKWPPSMVINKKDFSDAIHNIRYYLGVETQPAICDRYSYKQKFEYWGVIISAVLMIMTGIILWLPTFLTRFLPGEIEDDGQGFDVKTLFQQTVHARKDFRGLGLLGMKERASLIGGNLDIHSVPGCGTMVSLKVPLKTEEREDV